MTQTRIAIPSLAPGGLEAGIGAHFGHCEVYTLVDVAEGRIAGVATLPGIPHEEGGCLAAVDHLASQGVQVLIAGGLGMRPLGGFNQAGIEVYRGSGLDDVAAAVREWIGGGLPRFTRESACGGGSHGGHHHAH
jgi:predicted Fe-Mo cluster-binding NifX family protein